MIAFSYLVHDQIQFNIPVNDFWLLNVQWQKFHACLGRTIEGKKNRNLE